MSPQPVRLAEAAGALVLLIFVVGAVICLRLNLKKDQRRIVLIWLYFGLFWLISGLSVAVARYTFGIQYALDASRYVVAASFFVIATVVLAAIALSHLSTRVPQQLNAYSWFVSGCAVLAAVAIACRYEQTVPCIRLMQHMRYSELKGAVAAEASELLELPEFHDIYPHASFADFKTSLRFLNARGWLHPPLWSEGFLWNLRHLTPDPACGSLDLVTVRNGSVRLEGWGFLPSRSERAHAVIVAGFENNAKPKLLGVAFVSKERSDVAASLHLPEAGATGWTLELPQAEMQGHRYLVRTFSYDAISGKVCEANGERTIP
jgi:uncharacterized membrane protein SirB2